MGWIFKFILVLLGFFAVSWLLYRVMRPAMIGGGAGGIGDVGVVVAPVPPDAVEHAEPLLPPPVDVGLALETPAAPPPPAVAALEDEAAPVSKP